MAEQRSRRGLRLSARSSTRASRDHRRESRLAHPGKVALDKNESEWRFRPDAPWTEGRYATHVDGVIEDLAGNRLGKLFDVDTKDLS
jgi:hypothetical protein